MTHRGPLNGPEVCSTPLSSILDPLSSILDPRSTILYPRSTNLLPNGAYELHLEAVDKLVLSTGQRIVNRDRVARHCLTEHSIGYVEVEAHVQRVVDDDQRGRSRRCRTHEQRMISVECCRIIDAVDCRRNFPAVVSRVAECDPQWETSKRHVGDLVCRRILHRVRGLR